ncbi:MAG: TadE/TadG family type IV pilus assembly protein [Hyphomicrobiaceae bacterium]|nr:TadE/TadG family type IV pilus assembly protein [Hyphomicrobiaceae bacterium]
MKLSGSEATRGVWQVLGRVMRAEGGATAPTFAILAAAILLSVAVSIEYSRFITEVWRDQRAVDAAVLAASVKLGTPNQDSEGEALAQAFYEANRKDSTPSALGTITFDNETGEVTAQTQTTWQATLLNALNSYFPGIGDDKPISKRATVVKGGGSVEVALVLDNSGSMAGTHIENLRTAASNLLQVLFAGAEGTDRVMVGVVPFAASVNVGAGSADSGWIDTGGAASTHYENFAESRTRMQLFADMGQTWRGCVEARAGGHDVTDTPPASGDTLFVPMFSPDEPGDAGSNELGYSNSYLNDDGGSCTPYTRVCTEYSRRGNCRNWEVQRLPNAEAQARTCKYAGQSPNGHQGPNAQCTTQAILPLNATRSEVEAAVATMQASGNTNIKEGVAWGWRVLSPGVPFTEGREGDAQHNRKIMVLMTDGENMYNSSSTHNKSVYGAHGFAAKGRLGTTYSQSAYTNYLNARTREACTNAKAAGITIYTVAFRLENNPTTQALLRDCASGPDNVFTASDGAGLVQSFRSIGRDISSLRLAG